MRGNGEVLRSAEAVRDAVSSERGLRVARELAVAFLMIVLAFPFATRPGRGVPVALGLRFGVPVALGVRFGGITTCNKWLVGEDE